MSNVTGTIRARLVQASAVVITNTVLTASTETPCALSASTKAFTLRARGAARLQIAVTAGQSNTTYVTVPRGCSWSADSLDYSGTLYVRSDQNDVLELVVWS